MKPAAARTTVRAIGYVRVSTAEQAQSGLGLAGQRAAIVDFARRQGLDLVSTHADEGVSGAAPITERTGLLAAMQSLRRGDVLLVSRLDRLSRGNAIETAAIEQLADRKGARIMSTQGEGTEGTDPSAVLLKHMIQSIATYERSLISARTKAALRVKIARGERAGAERFGRDESERDALAIILDSTAAGCSPASIAADLNARGSRTRAGSPWRREYVRGILRTVNATRPAANKTRRANDAAFALVTRTAA